VLVFAGREKDGHVRAMTPEAQMLVFGQGMQEERDM